MPAVSRSQQTAMTIAEHAPSKLYKRNVGLKKMSRRQLHEFASTPRSSLPQTIGENADGAAPAAMRFVARKK